MVRAWIFALGTVLVMMGLAAGGSVSVAADVPVAATTRAPEKLQLALVLVADTNPTEYIFVLANAVGFKSVESLEKAIARMPAGSTLTWDPGCIRSSKEPLLNSATEMEAFKKFCVEHKVELVIVPSG